MMKKELSDIEQLTPMLIVVLLLVILCFIWEPAVSKQQDEVKPSSAIEVDLWNVWQVGIYIIN